MEELLQEAVNLNSRYDGRPPKAEEVLAILIKVLERSVAARAK